MLLATALGADTGKPAALVAQIEPPIRPRLLAPLDVSLLAPPQRIYRQLRTKRGGVLVQIGSKSPRRGFTLIELMVALAVLAIAGGRGAVVRGLLRQVPAARGRG